MRDRWILLVADRTAGSRRVRDALRARQAERRCRVTLLVPATPPTGTWTWDEAQVRCQARRRMSAALAELRRDGIDVRGLLGDFSPREAIRDELKRHPYEEIIISTLRPGVSRWLKQDLPSRAAREFQIPVIHVVSDDGTADQDREDAEPAA